MAGVRVQSTQIDTRVAPLPKAAWFGAAALFAAAGLGWLAAPAAFWPHPERLAPLAYFALDNRDSAVLALARARSTAVHEAGIVLLGSSAAREALWPEDRLQEAMGQTALNLTSSGQNPLESLFLLEQQPLAAGQRVVLFVGLSALGQARFAERLEAGDFLVDAAGFLARQADAGRIEWQAKGGLDEYRRQFSGLRRVLARATHQALPAMIRGRLYGTRPPQPLAHYYDGLEPPAIRRATETPEALHGRLGRHAERNLESYARLIEAIAAHCRRQGAVLSLVETPHRPGDTGVLFASWWGPYAEHLRRIAAAQAVPYLDLADAVAFADGDFFDAVHLTPSGREKWSSALVAALRRPPKS